MWVVVIIGVIGICIVLHYVRAIRYISNPHEKYVFISGCGTGFGNKLAKSLDRRGVHVYAGCVLQSSVELLNSETSSRLKAFQLDITDISSVKHAFKFVQDDIGSKSLWAVVNNAAIPAALVPFDWTTVEDYKKVMDVNFFGILRTTLTFLPLLKRGKGGRIVNASSMNSRLNIMSNAYGISKCSLEALSDGLSYEMRHFNISVHTLQPSIFKTPMSDPDMHGRLIQAKWDRLPIDVKEQYGEQYIQDKIKYTKLLYMRNTCSDLSQVIQAYEHAILSRYPRNRYIVGWDAKFLYLPLSWLPFPIQFIILPFAQKLAGLQEPIPFSCTSSK